MDRMSFMVHSKHLHMLRWKRFSKHTNFIEKNTEIYVKKLLLIDKEYQLSKDAAKRLSTSHKNYVLDINSDLSMFKFYKF